MISKEFIQACNIAKIGSDVKIIFFNGERLSLSSNALVVADVNTKAYIPFSGDYQLLVLPADVTPGIKWVEYIRLNFKYDVVVSCGSGTINDICKYTSYLDNKIFITFPTAPSVNGYTSSTASIVTQNGVKKSYKAHLPKIIYISLDVLAESPMRLVLSGFSEMLCRFTTRFDWFLSHLLCGTYYSDIPFTLVEQHEKQLISNRDKLLLKDRSSVQILIEGLLLGGLGMNMVGNSSPWSQSEHQIVHTMEVYNESNNYYHGEKIGVTTITASRLQQGILSDSLTSNRLSSLLEKVKGYYSDSMQHVQIVAEKHKCLTFANWPIVLERIRGFASMHDELEGILSGMGCFTQSEQIGWNSLDYKLGCEVACAMRNRFTCLDLLPYLSTEFDFCKG